MTALSGSISENAQDERKINHSTAYPSDFTQRGYLDVRKEGENIWKRKYFVLKDNHLLCGETELAKELEIVYLLEGSNVSKTTQNTSTTFQLFMKKHKLCFRAASPQQCIQWTEAIEKASHLTIKDLYRLLRTLGVSESQNNKVVEARHRITNQQCAIKVVDKRLCDKKSLGTEIQILKKLENPFIVQLYNLFENRKYLYVVMEFCQGGELFDQIANLDGEHYTEEDSCHVIHQIAKGVQYMHQCGIVHRDLKPENILCVYPKSIKRVKIADFGISKVISNDKESGAIEMKTRVGTLNYMAPEIFKQKSYNEKVDYWSVGVIMYILLCGYPPFWGDTDREIYDHIVKGEIVFEEGDWQHVSPDIINLVKGLLEKNPRQRKTMEDVLNVTWKVSSTKKAFRMAQTKFKETVVRRKLHRSSMGVFESDSKTMSKFYKDDKQEPSNSIAMDKKRQAFVGKDGSKGQEFLELNLPMDSRDSIDFK